MAVNLKLELTSRSVRNRLCSDHGLEFRHRVSDCMNTPIGMLTSEQSGEGISKQKNFTRCPD